MNKILATLLHTMGLRVGIKGIGNIEDLRFKQSYGYYHSAFIELYRDLQPEWDKKLKNCDVDWENVKILNRSESDARVKWVIHILEEALKELREYEKNMHPYEMQKPCGGQDLQALYFSHYGLIEKPKTTITDEVL